MPNFSRGPGKGKEDFKKCSEKIQSWAIPEWVFPLNPKQHPLSLCKLPEVSYLSLLCLQWPPCPTLLVMCSGRDQQRMTRTRNSTASPRLSPGEKNPCFKAPKINDGHKNSRKPTWRLNGEVKKQSPDPNISLIWEASTGLSLGKSHILGQEALCLRASISPPVKWSQW